MPFSCEKCSPRGNVLASLVYIHRRFVLSESSHCVNTLLIFCIYKNQSGFSTFCRKKCLKMVLNYSFIFSERYLYLKQKKKPQHIKQLALGGRCSSILLRRGIDWKGYIKSQLHNLSFFFCWFQMSTNRRTLWTLTAYTPVNWITKALLYRNHQQTFVFILIYWWITRNI